MPRGIPVSVAVQKAYARGIFIVGRYGVVIVRSAVTNSKTRMPRGIKSRLSILRQDLSSLD